MGNRGRKSTAELTTVGLGDIAPAQRLEPSADLSDETASIWRSIVNGKPADWFDGGSAPVLAQYCRHVIAARRVGQLISEEEGNEDFDPELWDRLLRAQERQSALVASLATKLRLTPQSRYGPRAATTAARRRGTGPKPWEE